MILSPHLERLCTANENGILVGDKGLRPLINCLEAFQHPGFNFDMLPLIKTAKTDAEYKAIMNDVGDDESAQESEPLVHLMDEMTDQHGFFLHESSTTPGPLLNQDSLIMADETEVNP